jgi:hypothetical protein
MCIRWLLHYNLRTSEFVPENQNLMSGFHVMLGDL